MTDQVLQQLWEAYSAHEGRKHKRATRGPVTPNDLDRFRTDFNHIINTIKAETWWEACVRIADGESNLDIAHVYQKRNPYLTEAEAKHRSEIVKAVPAPVHGSGTGGAAMSTHSSQAGLASMRAGHVYRIGPDHHPREATPEVEVERLRATIARVEALLDRPTKILRSDLRTALEGENTND